MLDRIFKDKAPKISLSYLALLRMMIGLMFITTWFSNMLKGFYTPDGLLDFFNNVFPQSANPLTWYAAFIENAILPIRHIFAPFQLITELGMGLALLFGFLTQFSSLAAGFFLVNTFLATYGHDWPWAYAMPIGILGVIFLARAGRALGIDGLLFKRFGERGFLLW